LVHIKGYDVLIDAFAQVSKEEPTAILIIGGDGPTRSDLVALTRQKGLDHKVLLPGVIMDTGKLYACCDVYVNSSRHEGLPITLLEAMAHKKPIVATNVGGNTEVIMNEITGLTVEAMHPETLADALLRVLRDKKLATDLAANAYQYFIDNFTIQKHCAELSKIYLS
jgi:glycosyltransferase involved in cell wall biosynthesis